MPDQTIAALLTAWRSLERERDASTDAAKRAAIEADIKVVKRAYQAAVTRRSDRSTRAG